MKLKINFKNILLFKRKKLVAIIFIVIMGITFAFVFNNNKLNKQYQNLIKEYNDNISIYNKEVDNLNNFLSKIKEYDLIESKEDFKNKDTKKFNVKKNKLGDIDSLNTDIENITNEITTIKNKYAEACQLSYDTMIENYNCMANRYNTCIKSSSIDFISGMPRKIDVLKTHNINALDASFNEEEYLRELKKIYNDCDDVIACCLVVDQIKVPKKEWILNRLKDIKKINECKAVTSDNDPNELLNKPGGYTSCIYFNIDNENISKVTGNNIIKEGTDCGGAIEVYPTLEAALNRCNYLSGFDDTILYSGSYTIIGTMVIRISYKLSNREQINLTNRIVDAFTTLS
ncbi:MAG: hypothetical protein MRZ46_05850 [Oscillospiraceae bacterium]|nr:hypothetical protein [Oscillospiraceae bacterium]